MAPLVWEWMRQRKVVDMPDGVRKRHGRPIPLGGGFALWLSVVVMTGIGVWRAPSFLAGTIPLSAYLALALGGLLLVCGGYADDRRSLPPRAQMLFPVLAALLAILGGVSIVRLTNPFGGVWEPGLWSPVLVFLWLMVSMYTTKLLDGVDGLATGVGAAGAALIALLASTQAFFQPDVRTLAVVLASALLGFLFWNRSPAVGYLGEGGSVLIGYFLGALAVLSGSKMATLLLVLAVPMLDVAWVVWSRYRRGVAVWKGDRSHLHHFFLDRGWAPGRILLFYMSVSASFGILALVVPRPWKYLLVLAVFMGVVGMFSKWRRP
jgi:UDP-GlcNAc:undecaprenyl-phosphate GlcNAc-1-phosphate transferase